MLAVTFHIKRTRRAKITIVVRGWMVLAWLLLSGTLLNNLRSWKVDVQCHQIAGAHIRSPHRSSNVNIRHQTEGRGKKIVEGGRKKPRGRRIIWRQAPNSSCLLDFYTYGDSIKNNLIAFYTPHNSYNLITSNCLGKFTAHLLQTQEIWVVWIDLDIQARTWSKVALQTRVMFLRFVSFFPLPCQMLQMISRRERRLLSPCLPTGGIRRSLL